METFYVVPLHAKVSVRTGPGLARALEASDRVEQQLDPFAQTYGHLLDPSVLQAASPAAARLCYAPLWGKPKPFRRANAS